MKNGMARRMGAAAMALLMAVTAAVVPGVTALAAGEGVATVGGTEYETLQAAVDAASSGGTVTMVADATEDVVFNPAEKAEYVLDLNGYTLTGTGEGSVITVAENATLTLTDNSEEQTGAVTGGSVTTNGGGVYNAGTLIMNGGTIKENTASSESNAYGGGVYNTGTFTMTGGTITGNTATTTSTKSNGDGGGVYNSGKFIMKGGKITENTATYHGGGIANYGTFILTDGEISNNIESSSTNSSSYGGSGVYNAGVGEVTMNGGSITQNTRTQYGTGVYNEGVFEMNGGSISENKASSCGGGVLNSGNFTLTGGEILKNTSEGNGGGIYTNNGSTTKIAGGTISNNTATATGGTSGGGGIYNAGELVIEDGNIINNTAEKGNGGGIYNNSVGCTISGGLISKNSANSNGGGIYINGKSTSDTAEFKMSGGTISYNTATSYGGGIGGTNCTPTISGGLIYGNSSGNTGGGVYNDSSTATWTGGLIYGNTATSAGADIMAKKFILNFSDTNTEDSPIQYLGVYDDSSGARYAETENPTSFEMGTAYGDSGSKYYMIVAYGITVSFFNADGSQIQTATYGDVAKTGGAQIAMLAAYEGEIPSGCCTNFTGWNTASDGSGQSYSAGETYTLISNTALYPEFTHVLELVKPDDGRDPYYKCTYCGACFEDEEGTIPLEDSIYSHNFEQQVVEPTCGSAGYTIYVCVDDITPDTIQNGDR